MKLRNKKTGEIINSKELLTDKFMIDLFSRDFDYFMTKLDKIQEEWEDYEEPKDVWWLDNEGNAHHATSEVDDNFEKNREIGNYFNTREDAEKAVEKLKAWKRLKDKGFRFTTWGKGILLDKTVAGQVRCELPIDNWDDVVGDLDLLFGGEE